MTFINANVLSNFVSLQCLSSLLNALLQNTMAEQNVPAQPPTRTDEQIVPRSQWLSIGKSNLLFNAQKIQKNPIFQISVDILSNTNFFQAFTASANVPAIYLQQFWKTMSYNEKTGVYSCQVDEQWFDLSADLLRKALAITPVNPAHPFELPPSGDTVIDFVNELGYPEPVEIVSSIRTNYVYQPWRAILCLLNQCLTGKTSGSDKPRHPVLQMLWGIVTQTNVDHAELIWEEFTQGIQTFFSHKASHKASLKNPKKKVTPLLIPYGRFSKVIIYYLASNNNIHRRPDSAVHHTGDDYVLGNLKFVPKGESVEVFGMAIPDPLITEAIQQSSYYPKYLKMVAENTKKTPQESASTHPATKRATPKKPTTTTPVKQTKPAPPPSKKPSKQSNPQEEGNDPDLELAKKLSLETHQEKGEGEGDDADLERAIKPSLGIHPFQPQEVRAPEKSKVREESDSTILDSSHQTVTLSPPYCSLQQRSHLLSRHNRDHKRKHDSDDDDEAMKMRMMKAFSCINQDEGNVSDMRSTDNAHIPKVSTTTGLKGRFPESERPATPNHNGPSPRMIPKPEHNWANHDATTYKFPGKQAFKGDTLSNPEGIKFYTKLNRTTALRRPPCTGNYYNPNSIINNDLDYLLTVTKTKNGLYPYHSSKPSLPNSGLEEISSIHRLRLKWNANMTYMAVKHQSKLTMVVN
ncbi:hypothetical protein Tco_1407422 [Tanacetum coccineum]